VNISSLVCILCLVVMVASQCTSPPALSCQPNLVVQLNANGNGVIDPLKLLSINNDPCTCCPTLCKCPGAVEPRCCEPHETFQDSFCSDVQNGRIAEFSRARNCRSGLLSFSPLILNCSHLGISNITITASGLTGLSSTISCKVNVSDKIRPAITCPSNITMSTSGSSTVVNYTPPVGTDNCLGVTTTPAVGNNASGSSFSVGVHTETFTATDSSGNTAQCSFTITVTVATVSCSCPASDLAGFSLDVVLNPSPGVIHCSYPVFAGEDPNDFFCLYSTTAPGALTQDHDAGLCRSNAINC